MGNYKLVTRQALDAAMKYAATQPLFELMVARAGFKATHVDVSRRARPVNSSAYAFSDSLRFIGNLLVSYSSLFFRIMAFAGILLIAAGSFGFVFCTELKPLFLAGTAFITGGISLTGAILGYYLRFLQNSVRGWPAYIVEEEA
jgi:hypothetical protein